MNAVNPATATPTGSRGLETRVAPPIMMLVTAGAMALASAVTPPVRLPLALRLAGIAGLVIVGGMFGVRAFRAFGKAGTTTSPTRPEDASTLVTGGVYGITRNPMYVGLTSLLLTLALALSNAWLLLGPLAFVGFITRFQIIPEERAMLAKFGPEYAAYRRRVRRWL